MFAPFVNQVTDRNLQLGLSALGARFMDGAIQRMPKGEQRDAYRLWGLFHALAAASNSSKYGLGIWPAIEVRW